MLIALPPCYHTVVFRVVNWLTQSHCARISLAVQFLSAAAAGSSCPLPYYQLLESTFLLPPLKLDPSPLSHPHTPSFWQHLLLNPALEVLALLNSSPLLDLLTYNTLHCSSCSCSCTPPTPGSHAHACPCPCLSLPSPALV